MESCPTFVLYIAVMYLQTQGSTIWFDRKGFSALDAFLANEVAGRRVFVLVDNHTHKFCWPLVKPYFEVHCTPVVFEIPAGEQYKSLETATRIWDFLLENGADRKSLLVNLGGGVICDIGGFAASVFKRGIDFIHIPTTLLAQVDASVGGKTGIDYAGLKNMIGTFHEPVAVFIHDVFLETLDKTQILSGFSESLKHALIDNKGYWNYLKTFDFKNYERLIFKSVEIKKKIVCGDYRERHDRKKLNFGHTIGHAIESFYLKHKPAPLLHGEAIAVGMICETFISKKLGLLSPEPAEEILQTIRGFYPSISLDPSHDRQLLEYMAQDKKADQQGKNFTLLEAIGLARIGQQVPDLYIMESLNDYRSLYLD